MGWIVWYSCESLKPCGWLELEHDVVRHGSMELVNLFRAHEIKFRYYGEMFLHKLRAQGGTGQAFESCDVTSSLGEDQEEA